MKQNNNHSSQAATPEIKPNRPISAIWLLPFLALLLGGYLTYQSINEAGIMIQIHFSDGEGIIEGKTPVKYKGLTVGRVKSIQPDRRLAGVNVLVEMDPRAESALTQGTKFWLVKPQASLTRISGLDTILSGNYIGVKPGKGPSVTEFQAVNEPPIQIPSDDLLVRLHTQDPGSINVGSPVYHKHIEVGKVVRVQLSDNKQEVTVQLHIQSDYRHLVTQQSRFWNVSGLHINANLSGLEVQSESLATLIAGGIAFDSPPDSPVIKAEHAPFELYPSVKAANRGIAIELSLPSAEGLALKGTSIRYMGLTVGNIEQLKLSEDQNSVTGTAYLDPALAKLLGDDTQFWLLKPKISLEGVKNLDTLVMGYHIQLSPATQSSDKRQFEVLAQKPADTTELMVELVATNSYGTIPGDPIRYRGLAIGRVDSLALNQADQVVIKVFFKGQYSDLVKKNSRFYIESAIDVQMSLQQGLGFTSQPLDTMLTGGISLYQPEHEPASQPVMAGEKLSLFGSKALAQQGMVAKPYQLKLVTENLKGLQKGAQIYYQEFPVGQVTDIALLPNRQKELSLAIESQYRALINDSSRFWHVSGVDVKASLSGIEIKSSSLMAVAMGGLSFETPEPNASQTTSEFKLYTDRALALNETKVIHLSAPVQSQLKEGNPVLYGGFQIGTIAQLTLSEDLNHLLASIHLDANYADSFMRETAQFWLESAEIGLSGIKNPSALLTGDFIGARPGSGELKASFKASLRRPRPIPQDDALIVYLTADKLGSIDEGSPILYRQKSVGQVIHAELNQHGTGVIIQAEISPEYKHLVRANSQFWNVSGIQADIGLFSGVEVKAESVTTIIRGGITFSTPGQLTAEPQANYGSRYRLLAKAPKS